MKSRFAPPPKARLKAQPKKAPKKVLKSLSVKPAGRANVRAVARGENAAAKLPNKQASENASLSTEYVELFPHGISVSTALGRPVLILKDRAAVEVLPVWMHPLDAGVALAELSQGSGMTPHSVTRRLLEQLNTQLETVVFTEIVGHHQFVDLTFRGPNVIRLSRVRADEAMSFSLQARAKFYSTKPYMAQCRSLDADLTTFENNLNQGQLSDLKSEIENSSKKNPYVI